MGFLTHSMSWFGVAFTHSCVMGKFWPPNFACGTCSELVIFFWVLGLNWSEEDFYIPHNRNRLTSSFKNVLFIFQWARTLCIGSGLSCHPNSDCLLCFSLPGTLWLDNAADGPEIFICWLLSGISWLTNYDGSQNTCAPSDSAQRQFVCSFIYLWQKGKKVWWLPGWGDQNSQLSVSCECRSEYTEQPNCFKDIYWHFQTVHNLKGNSALGCILFKQWSVHIQ